MTTQRQLYRQVLLWFIGILSGIYQVHAQAPVLNITGYSSGDAICEGEIFQCTLFKNDGTISLTTGNWVIEATSDGSSYAPSSNLTVDQETEIVSGEIIQFTLTFASGIAGENITGIQAKVTDTSDEISNSIAVSIQSPASISLRAVGESTADTDPLLTYAVTDTQQDLYNAIEFALNGGSSYNSITGGTFTGTGVINNTFYPSIATEGTHSIMYTYEKQSGDGLTCIPDPVTFNVLVNTAPTPPDLTVSLDGGNNFVSDAGSVCIGTTLTYRITQGTTALTTGNVDVFIIYTDEFSNQIQSALAPSFNLNGDGTMDFDLTFDETYPSPAGIAVMIDSETQLSNTVDIILETPPVVTFSTDELNYIVSDGTVTLADVIDVSLDGMVLTNPLTNGVFTGTGVTSNEFDPGTGEGVYTITYTYTDNAATCTTTSADFTINVGNGDGMSDLFYLVNSSIHTNALTTCVGETLNFVLYKADGAVDLDRSEITLIGYDASNNETVISIDENDVIVVSSNLTLQFPVTLTGVPTDIERIAIRIGATSPYTYSNELAITIDPLSTVSIQANSSAPSPLEYRITDNPITLTDIFDVVIDGSTTLQAGDITNNGYFTGTGVTDNVFYPNSFDNSSLGTKTITYIYTGGGCGMPGSTYDITIIQASNPELYLVEGSSLSQSDLTICTGTTLEFFADGAGITNLQVFNGTALVTSVVTISSTVDGYFTYTFNNSGTYTIGVQNSSTTYSSSDISNTITITTSTPPTVTLDTKTGASLTFSKEGDPVDLDGLFDITTSAGGGTGVFTGNGVSESNGTYYFSPSVFQTGTFPMDITIQYIYTLGQCSSNPVNITLTVIDPDDVFTIASSYCENEADVTPTFNLTLGTTSTLQQITLSTSPTTTTQTLYSGGSLPATDGQGRYPFDFTLSPSSFSGNTFVTITATVVTLDNGFLNTTDYSDIIIINPIPALDFTIASEICRDGAIVALSPTVNNATPSDPTQGSFTYTGTTTGTIAYNSSSNTYSLDPGTFNTGNYEITYTYTDDNSCTAVSTPATSFTIYQDVVSFTGLADEDTFCINSDGITLTPQKNGVTIADTENGVFTVTNQSSGISTDLAGLFFDPTTYSDGTYDVEYIYNNGDCEVSSGVIEITIYPVPTLTLEGTETSYCIDETTATISLVPTEGSSAVSGGIFYLNGNALTDGEFDATDYGVGTYSLIYTYTNSNQCEVTSASRDITIYALPSLQFSIQDNRSSFCINNSDAFNLSPQVLNTTTNQFEAPSTSSLADGRFVITQNSVVQFDISVNSGLYTLTPTDFITNSLATGVYQIHYEYTNENGCTNTSDSQDITIYEPLIDFTNLADEDIYCANNGVITLTPTIDGETITDVENGFFTIDGIALETSDIDFDPSTYHQLKIDNGQAETDGSTRHTILYTYTDLDGGCTVESVTKDFTVRPIFTVAFSISNDAFCIDESSDNIIFTPTVDGTEVTGSDLNNGYFTVYINSDLQNGATFTTFDPATYGAGTHLITYTYTDPTTNCSVTSTSTALTINSLPDVEIAQTTIADSYCLDEGRFTLSILQRETGFDEANGTIILTDTEADPTEQPVRVTGTTTVVFDSADFGITDKVNAKEAAVIYNIAYEYANPITGCITTSTLSYTVSINPYPNYAFTVTTQEDGILLGTSSRESEVNIEDTEIDVCQGQALIFAPESYTDSQEITWRWSFGNENSSDTETTEKTFNNLGTFDVVLTKTYTNDAGCTDVQVIRVNVNPVPVAGFVYSGSCQDALTFDASESTVNTYNSSTITSYTWDFGDGTTETTTNPVIQHVYTEIGKKTVTLTIGTGFGCTNTVSQEAFVFPSFTPTSDSRYVEDFESGTGGWIDSGTNSSWGISSSTGIESQDGNAWVMNEGSGYNNNEQSFIESPCFNLDALTNPIISMRLWTETDENSDGVVLLASVNDGTSWEVVGTIGGGLDWYNSQGILGGPGEDSSVDGDQNSNRLGWSGSTGGWKTARYSLREVKANLETDATSVGYVRFRLAFGSNSDNPTGETLRGVAVDEVMIREKNRFVLVEHFTNTSSSDAQTEDAALTTFMESPSNTNVIDIRYHTDFPNDDVLNAENQADPSARALHYGIPKVPRSVLDGIYFENKSFSEDSWGSLAYTTRTLLDAPFDIAVSTEGGKSGEALTIAATLSKNDSYESLIESNLVVQIAVIEHLVDGQYRNVLRKLLPHAAGTRVTGTWAATGETRTETVTETWAPDRDATAGEFGIVVFVQDEVTKEVYQAAYLSIDTELTGTKSTASAILNSAEEEKAYTIAPNPSVSNFTVAFTPGHEPKEDTRWVVYDSIGLIQASGVVKKGNTSLQVNLSRPGAYTFRLEEGTYKESKMIRH